MKKNISDLIILLKNLKHEGVTIAIAAHEEISLHYNADQPLYRLCKRYSRWNSKIEKLLDYKEIEKQEINTDPIYQDRSFLLTSGGFYGDIQSEKSKNLLEKIRTGANKKSDFLETIKVRLERIDKNTGDENSVGKELSVNVKEIVCVIPKSQEIKNFKIVINKDYLGYITVRGNKNCWNLLMKLANKERILSDSKYKSSYDYFNYNGDNRIYIHYGYELTNILRIEKPFILPNIKLSAIGEIAFKKRSKKQKDLEE